MVLRLSLRYGRNEAGGLFPGAVVSRNILSHLSFNIGRLKDEKVGSFFQSRNPSDCFTSFAMTIND
jgi:hypothetical protein